MLKGNEKAIPSIAYKVKEDYKKEKITKFTHAPLVIIIFIICCTAISIRYIDTVASKQTIKNEELDKINTKLNAIHEAATENGMWPAGVKWK